VRSRSLRARDILLALVVLAALLRLWRIGHQSYWLDEAFTVDIVRDHFGGMLDGVRHTESTPPLYYALAWLWERVFGWHEVGLRSLSALFGVATVPVAYAAARELFKPRAALLGAVLVAVNPYLVWYSQEARAYALLILLCTAALVYFLRAERDPGDRRSLWLWAAIGALALLTHYFAAFLLLPEAAWLVYRRRSWITAAAIALPAAVATALLPLAIEQRDSGHTLFISHIPFGERLVSLPKKVVTGELGTPTPAIGPVAGAAVVAGALLALFAVRGPERRGVRLLAGLVAANLGIALLIKLFSADYFFARNLIEVFVPALLVLGAGFASLRLGAAPAAIAVGVALAVVVQSSLNASLQRDDWRGLVRALGPAHSDRAIVLTPEVGKTPFALYAGELSPFPPVGFAVPEVDVVANARPPRFAPPPPPPGFRLAQVRRSDSWQLVRFVSLDRSPTGLPPPDALRLQRDKEAISLLQLPPRGRG
jgi:hypothetical protein